MPQLEQNLKHALELSHEIFRLAEEKQWPELQQLDQRRMQLLESIFKDPALIRDRVLQGQIEQILALNERTVAICEEAKESVMQDGKRLKLGREAIQAYRKQSQD
ncbi:MAG: flagellar protein FliT [Candidatus Thiodiazotropha sp.]